MISKKCAIIATIFFLISNQSEAMKRAADSPVDEPAAKRSKITDDLRISTHEKLEFEDKFCGDFKTKLSYALEQGNFFKSTVYLRRLNTRSDFDSNAIMSDIAMSDKWTEQEQIALYKLLPQADFENPVEPTNGSTPVHIAVTADKQEVLHYLLHEKGVDPRLEDVNGYEPILFAKSADVAKMLWEKGAELNVQDIFGKTLLHLSDNKKLTRFLLDQKLDPNQTDNKRRTPLFGSAGLNQWENAAELMAGGADHTKRDYAGQTPYERHEKKYGDANPVVMNMEARGSVMKKFEQKHGNPVVYLDQRSRTTDQNLKHLRIAMR